MLWGRYKIQKEIEVEKGSLEDLNQILKLAKEKGLKVIVIGGYAVRAYTKTRPRYTKDIDLAVQKEEDLPKLKGILRRVGHVVKDRPHGFSGYRKVRGVAITVNVTIESIQSRQRAISSFYPQISLSLKARIASIEDLLILKTKLWRERDIIDVCLMILDSFDIIDCARAN